MKFIYYPKNINKLETITLQEICIITIKTFVHGKNKTVILFVFAIFSQWGCSNQPKKDDVVFPITQSVILKEVQIPEVLALPFNLLIHRNHIVIYDGKTDYFLKLFSTDDFEYKGQAIRRGRGPNEEVDISYQFKNYKQDTFLYHNTSSVKLGNFENSNLSVMHEYTIPADMYGDSEFFIVNDKICSAASYMPMSRDFRCFNINSGDLFEWGEQPPIIRPKSLPSEEPFYIAKYATINEELNLLAVVYQNLPILRIYCTKTGILKSQIEMADWSSNKEFFEKNTYDVGFITYYLLLRSTSEYIFGLYPGKALSFDDNSIPDVSSTVHVWKWDGTPVMEIEFDRSIFSFDITPNNKQIIASSIIDIDKLFVTDIPWVTD
jgi:hypothetical protein